MPRLARIAVAGLPYHVTQRGNRRQPVFFQDADYRLYLHLLRQQSQRWGLQVWAYCLMPNHVHLIVWPTTAASLARGIGETHRRYTRAVNFREGWRGYLWQGRFASVPLDEPYCYAAVRYVERNPVAAGVVTKAWDYPWSSASAHIMGQPDPVLNPCFLTETIPDWAAFLTAPEEADHPRELEQPLRTGRPVGSPAFLARLEQHVGRRLTRAKPGPKPVAVT